MMKSLLLLLTLATSCVTVDLGNGERLRIPPSAQYVNDVFPLPGELFRSSVYSLPTGTLLYVNVSEPMACNEQVLESEMRKAEALASQDRNAGASDKIVHSKLLRVGSHSAYYLEGRIDTIRTEPRSKPPSISSARRTESSLSF